MPTPSFTTVGNNIVAFIQSIPYLQAASGGTVKLAADPKPLVDFSVMPTPFVLVVPAGESVKGDNLNLGGSVFETFMMWEFYLGASSFALEGEGLTGSVEGDPGINQMVDDIVAACLGRIVSTSPASKMFPANPFGKRYTVTAQAIVWTMGWRNQWQRIGV
jgi:hypothetical protein